MAGDQVIGGDPFGSSRDPSNYMVPSADEVYRLHTNADTDRDRSALHHTLGPRSNQAARGDHIHNGENGNPLTSYELTGKITPTTVSECAFLINQLIDIVSEFCDITDSRT